MKPLAILLVALLLLLGGCGHQEDSPEVPVENATVEGDSAEAGEDPSGEVEPGRVALEEIPFQPQGDFPHGEHRRIECASCHGRPPGHATHASVDCTSCHGRPAEYASLPVRSRAECMSCHHDPDGSGECSRCHASPPQDVLTLESTVRMSVWTGERTREVSFDHRLHREVECGRCHGDAPEKPLIRECRSCHEDHHRPEARCLTCHQGVEEEPHGPEVHLGCGGSGCHQDPVVNALPPSRAFCLVCHEAQVDHQPGQDCATCHFLDEPGARGAGRVGVRP